MSAAHSINLSRQWSAILTLSGQQQSLERIDLPRSIAELAERAGFESLGTGQSARSVGLKLTRRFNTPTGLEQEPSIWLRFDSLPDQATVSFNEAILEMPLRSSGNDAAFQVATFLQPSLHANQVVVELDSHGERCIWSELVLGAVALEISDMR